ncbi:MAG TPA: DUF5615 family PIN-like protein [Dehalococcoidia bacterium]|nr:DUF5615 family PIN-like protein [Dehalococcoidia bacterium]
MRLYLDEDLSHRIAEIGRAHGLDVVSSHECGRDGLSDEDQLRLAAAEGRCFVTRNYGCFAALARTFLDMGWPHSGVLFLPPSLPNDSFAGIAAALLDYSQKHPGGLAPYQVDYLRPVPAP